MFFPSELFCNQSHSFLVLYASRAPHKSLNLLHSFPPTPPHTSLNLHHGLPPLHPPALSTSCDCQLLLFLFAPEVAEASLTFLCEKVSGWDKRKEGLGWVWNIFSQLMSALITHHSWHQQLASDFLQMCGLHRSSVFSLMEVCCSHNELFLQLYSAFDKSLLERTSNI